MLQLTLRRVSDPALFAPPIIVASGDQAEAIEAQLAEMGDTGARLIVEPAARNTAPAIALAALESGPDELLLVLPSDHHVERPDALRAAVEAGQSAAREDWLVTFGVAPERPETGYGYIKAGGELGGGAFAVERFVEKPDRETAERYLADGGYAWNAGIFLFKAGTYLRALAAHAPAAADAVRKGRFAEAPSLSVDRAVMEKAERVAVVPVDMGWSDVGSWEALHTLGPADSNGNVLSGDVVAPGSRGCLVRSDGPVVAALGVEDLVIVATERAVLVVPRGQSQRVKEAIEALEARRNRQDEEG
jgi:mannose-1-phosphate guanylyltransferase/mannose-1-phosphate guanylyltransferase/mannose-6-phosphate isomerase